MKLRISSQNSRSAAFPCWVTALSLFSSAAITHGEEAFGLPGPLAKAMSAEPGKFSPAVKKAWLDLAKETALAEIQKAGKELPAEFLAWVDGDPAVSTTIYGAALHPAGSLLVLRALELDLGKDVVRKRYTQLALSFAIARASEGFEVDLRDRPLLELTISGDPRVPVDTNDPNRKLDRNDHIINFLNSNRIVGHVVGGEPEELPPLIYDENGVAIPQEERGEVKNRKEPMSRSLYAADVLASRELQIKFNEYMREHGENVSIDCGDQAVHWKSTEAVSDVALRKRIADAVVLFRTAYEEKGLLPKARDAAPTPSEAMAWLIRNDEFVFPKSVEKDRQWPRFPINSPWPVTLLLAADDQPLREREERWTSFRDKGEVRKYGEYIGGVAQQFDMQTARRIAPYPFHYQTYQMFNKDGGVCGTMAAMGARTSTILGVPVVTAGEPGHCALIAYYWNEKKSAFEVHAEQSIDGNPDTRVPHGNWVFSDDGKRRKTAHWESLAWAVNHDFPGYLESLAACRLYLSLKGEARKSPAAMDLLLTALEKNPYNVLTPDLVRDSEFPIAERLRFWRAFKVASAPLEAAGGASQKYYVNLVREDFARAAATLPVPIDREGTAEVLATLQEENCRNAKALVKYQVDLLGIDKVLPGVRGALRAYASSERNEETAGYMKQLLEEATAQVKDKSQRDSFLESSWSLFEGREVFLGEKSKILVDPVAELIQKRASKTMSEERVRLRPVLESVAKEVRAHVQGERSPGESKKMAEKIQAIDKQITDRKLSRTWLESLDRIMAGAEKYSHKGEEQTDPTAAAVKELLSAEVSTAEAGL